NGTESKYVLTGLAQCGSCNGGLFVHSPAHGSRRAYFYACTSYHLRGRKVCANRQLLPMELTNASVLETLRSDLLNPKVIERALQKLEARLSVRQPDTRATQLEGGGDRIRTELGRLTSALAAGGHLASLVSAVRDREQRLTTIDAELGRADEEISALDVPLAVVMSDVRSRLEDWRQVLSEESAQARQMPRTLLRGRIVFTPDIEHQACDYVGEGDLSAVFRGLIAVPKMFASPT